MGIWTLSWLLLVKNITKRYRTFCCWWWWLGKGVHSSYVEYRHCLFFTNITISLSYINENYSNHWDLCVHGNAFEPRIKAFWNITYFCHCYCSPPRIVLPHDLLVEYWIARCLSLFVYIKFVFSAMIFHMPVPGFVIGCLCGVRTHAFLCFHTRLLDTGHM